MADKRKKNSGKGLDLNDKNTINSEKNELKDSLSEKSAAADVMVVDDHEPSLKMTCSFLSQLGYSVTAAINGADALEKIAQKRPDVIVSDVLMPVMDGYTLCRELKKDENLSNIPVVFISSTYIDPHDMELGLSAGAEEYIVKGNNAHEFMKKLKDIIDSSIGNKTVSKPEYSYEKFMENYHDILTRKLRDKIQEIEDANKKIYASEKKFRLVMENIEDIFWMSNPGFTKVYYISPSYEKFWKKSCNSLIKNPDSFIKSIHPDDTEKYLQMKENYHKQGKAYECEYRINPQKDYEYWIHERGFPVFDEQNQNLIMVGVCTDITQRKAAEYKLQVSHEMFLTVLDGIDSTIFVSDLESNEILFMNKCMKELFGKDLTGQPCWKVLKKKEGPCSNCNHPKILDENNNPTGVKVSEGTHTITGRLNIFHDSAIRWVDGRLVHLQIATDITDYKEMEAKQLEYERYLQQAQKMEAIGTLAGGIAHDFNNILSPLMGYTEILQSNLPKESKNHKYVDEIMHASLRAKDLVQQILTFSRQESHEVKPVKLQIIIKEVLKLIRASIPSTIDIQQDLDKHCGLVNAEPTQIHQIIMNLVTNAFHAMEETGGKLKVSLKQLELKRKFIRFAELKPGNYALLKVSDTGAGINKEILSKVFDPYFTTKGLGKGTGLGLSVVQGIVNNFKGDIHIESNPGKGTDVMVYLPIVAKAYNGNGVEPTEAIIGGDERILLVDDDASIVGLGKDILERLGYKVTTSSGSMDALEVFKNNPEAFDLVITDMTMPKMTGVELVKEIRSVKSDVPVIISTGYSENLNKGKVKELGIQELLLKPMTIRRLSHAVRTALNEKKASS